MAIANTSDYSSPVPLLDGQTGGPEVVVEVGPLGGELVGEDLAHDGQEEAASSIEAGHHPDWDTSFDPHQSPGEDFRGVPFPLSTVLLGAFGMGEAFEDFVGDHQDTGLPSSTGGPQWEPLTDERGREAGKSGFVGPLIRVSAFAEQVKLDHIAFVGGQAILGGAIFVQTSRDEPKDPVTGRRKRKRGGLAKGLEIENCDFRRNSAVNGGALYFAGGVGNSIKGSSFISNVALNCGGAIYAVEAFSKLHIHASVLHRNRDQCGRGTTADHLQQLPARILAGGGANVAAGPFSQAQGNAQEGGQKEGSSSAEGGTTATRSTPSNSGPVAGRKRAKRFERQWQQQKEDLSGAVSTGTHSTENVFAQQARAWAEDPSPRLVTPLGVESSRKGAAKVVAAIKAEKAAQDDSQESGARASGKGGEWERPWRQGIDALLYDHLIGGEVTQRVREYTQWDSQDSGEEEGYWASFFK
mmetsp:Transcript_40258/g.90356  ORF Transcript_40258/g.90356 Transcript_40258/m.90356 type:complete len:469 (+) Transcript_40258:866-2272(+)